MKRQQKTWWCSAAALQNAFRFYGHKISQTEIAELIGLGYTENTMLDDPAEGLKRAILHLGYSFDELSTSVRNDAVYWLNNTMLMPRNGHPVLLCVDDWSHWVTLLGAAGCQGYSRWSLFDPGNYDWLKSEHGWRVWDNKNLLKHWRSSWLTSKELLDPDDPGGATTRRPYYALSVVK